eukprot:Rhum_TRINITY_DN24894_c0_g1::Rhum_TRINITY_DN24894_c0_g1_i1::g.180423::m.180423
MDGQQLVQLHLLRNPRLCRRVEPQLEAHAQGLRQHSERLLLRSGGPVGQLHRLRRRVRQQEVLDRRVGIRGHVQRQDRERLERDRRLLAATGKPAGHASTEDLLHGAAVSLGARVVFHTARLSGRVHGLPPVLLLLLGRLGLWGKLLHLGAESVEQKNKVLAGVLLPAQRDALGVLLLRHDRVQQFNRVPRRRGTRPAVIHNFAERPHHRKRLHILPRSRQPLGHVQEGRRAEETLHQGVLVAGVAPVDQALQAVARGLRAQLEHVLAGGRCRSGALLTRRRSRRWRLLLLRTLRLLGGFLLLLQEDLLARLSCSPLGLLLRVPSFLLSLLANRNPAARHCRVCFR